TNQLTTVLTSTANSEFDSLIFNSSGQIIYDDFNQNQIRLFDPATKQDKLLSSNNVDGPLDLALEPGGKSVLISNNTAGYISRLALETLKTTVVGPGYGDGLTYDNNQRLFAFVPGAMVAQLNPSNLSIVNGNVSPSIPGLDGLAFDSNNGMLYGSTDGNGQVY